jgi:hypothetical protein
MTGIDEYLATAHLDKRNPFAFGYLPPIIGRPADVCAALKVRQAVIDHVVDHGEKFAAEFGDGRMAEIIKTIQEERLASYWLEIAVGVIEIKGEDA